MGDQKVTEAFDIYIIGLGVVSIWQITREAEAALSRSKEVLYVSGGFGVKEYLEQLCPKVTNLHEAAYREGVGRLNAYHIMAAMVIDAALEHPPVTFALDGHPLVFVYPSRQILEAAPHLGLRVKVVPGISAMDCLFIDLNLDPGWQGLQMYEATDILLRERPLQADVPCFIWQIGAVETRLFTKSPSRPERFSRIKNYLLKYYPPDHKVVAVHSSVHPLVSSNLVVFPISDIEMQWEYLHQGATLYIPPVNARPITDQDLLKEVDSVSHLKKITQFED